MRRGDTVIRLNFPGNQEGQIKGVADVGIENLTGQSFLLWREKADKTHKMYWQMRIILTLLNLKTIMYIVLMFLDVRLL